MKLERLGLSPPENGYDNGFTFLRDRHIQNVDLIFENALPGPKASPVQKLGPGTDFP